MFKETALSWIADLEEAGRINGLDAVDRGLLFSQILTLYVTPVFYVYLDHFSHWLKRR